VDQNEGGPLGKRPATVRGRSEVKLTLSRFGSMSARPQLARARVGSQYGKTLPALDYDIVFGPAKTERSERAVPLSAAAVEQLRGHKSRQNEDRLAWPGDWPNDLVFMDQTGSPIHPSAFSRTRHRTHHITIPRGWRSSPPSLCDRARHRLNQQALQRQLRRSRGPEIPLSACPE